MPRRHSNHYAGTRWRWNPPKRRPRRTLQRQVLAAAGRPRAEPEDGRPAAPPRAPRVGHRAAAATASAAACVNMRHMSQKVSHARDGSGEPLLTIAGRNVGLRKAFQALTFMAAWDRARQALRRETLTLDEYADWWKVSRATAHREQSRFREAFPGELTPEHLLDLAEGQWVERQGVKGLGAVKLA